VIDPTSHETPWRAELPAYDGTTPAADEIHGRIAVMIEPAKSGKFGLAVASGIVGIYASYHLRTAAGASVVVAMLGFYLLAALAGTLQHRRIPARR
jgi:hypothetical protein